MKTFLISTLALFLAVGHASAQCIPLTLFVGTDPDDPGSQDESHFQGDKDFYIWSVYYGFRSASFGLASTFDIVSIDSAPGVVVSGTHSDLRLITENGDCDRGDIVLLATITVRDNTGDGGAICFVPTASTGALCIETCSDGVVRPDAFGFHSTGTPQCAWSFNVEGCTYLSVEDSSWSEIKNAFRSSNVR